MAGIKEPMMSSNSSNWKVVIGCGWYVYCELPIGCGKTMKHVVATRIFSTSLWEKDTRSSTRKIKQSHPTGVNSVISNLSE
jgi:hypothetical protein